MTTVAVVGAGIAGLSVAEALVRDRPDLDVVVIERSGRVGGNIRTEVTGGFTCERGPDGFLDSAPETLALVRRVGLADRLLPSDDAARKRFVFRGGRLHRVPLSPAEFVQSRLLSWAGKLRIAAEPFARRAPRRNGDDPRADETIHEFASRRIGVEAASVLIDSMVSGIFAGDARALSLRACFPKMAELEATYGSLVRAMIAKRRQRRASDAPGAPAGRLMSFRGGMDELVRGVAAHLGHRVLTGRRVTAIQPRPEGGYTLRLHGQPARDVDAVVLTGPASEAASIVSSLDPDLSTALATIDGAPLAVVCLGYDAAALAASRGPLDGFGFLVPRGEGPRILGALWESSIYPGRAPADKALIRVMIGGARDPGAVELDDDTLVRIVSNDLRTTMGLDLEPCFLRIYRHRLGIPQYTRGHLRRLQRIDERLAHFPGLYVAGNAYRGVAINSCIADAGPLATRIVADLERRGLDCRPLSATA